MAALRRTMAAAAGVLLTVRFHAAGNRPGPSAGGTRVAVAIAPVVSFAPAFRAPAAGWWVRVVVAAAALAVVSGLTTVWLARRGADESDGVERRGPNPRPGTEPRGPTSVGDAAQPAGRAPPAVGHPRPGPASVEGRLADEAMQHVRGLASKGTVTGNAVVLPDPTVALRATGVPGQRVTLSLEIGNPHDTAVFLTPLLTPLVAPSGAVWIPEAQPATLLLEPGDAGVIRVTLRLPNHLPADVYRGALVVQGIRERAAPVTIAVSAAPASRR